MSQQVFAKLLDRFTLNRDKQLAKFVKFIMFVLTTTMEDISYDDLNALLESDVSTNGLILGQDKKDSFWGLLRSNWEHCIATFVHRFRNQDKHKLVSGLFSQHNSLFVLLIITYPYLARKYLIKLNKNSTHCVYYN